ncbi:hypothetical protein BR63_11165 [Thermanaerosceptrum fracticalcis]|jgi:hypothetical protein|uniref:Uncharacterized protein n=1 Tax=Thermanaerosceptrum fracticalcis TaxID=1712410 RepID=A0A7G6E416_THEFR|nr:hypothetical protein [Thermanaerosceptrum fracticalcis]QNB46820.1 hypothetical protein BR63_11165 [Thermanaerosceptrum fracticalcis]
MAHEVCMHEKDWGIHQNKLENLEKCTEKLKVRQDEADKRMDDFEKAQVTKADFKEFRTDMMKLGAWAVFFLIAGQILVGWLSKIGVIQ